MPTLKRRDCVCRNTKFKRLAMLKLAQIPVFSSGGSIHSRINLCFFALNLLLFGYDNALMLTDAAAAAGTQKCQRNAQEIFICKQVLSLSEVVSVLSSLNETNVRKILIENGSQHHFLLDLAADVTTTNAAFLSKLEVLDFSKAGYVDFETENAFSSMKALRLLNISNCHLEELRAAHFPISNQLQNFDASGNELQTLDSELMKRFSKLRSANLSRNSLRVLQNGIFKELQNLEYLNLNNNELQNVTFGLIPNLQFLTINDNLIRRLTFAENHAMLPVLQTLHLAANSLSLIEEGIFENFKILKLLNLSSNSLTTLGPMTFLGLERLVYLDLSLNDLQTLNGPTFQYTPKLQSLDISGNSLDDFTGGIFRDLTMLRKLFMQNNNLKSLEDDSFAGLINLDTLDLSDNALTYIGANVFGAQTLPKMRKLLLRTNNLKELHPLAFASLPFLEYLSLGQNELKTLDVRMFAPLRRLEKLHLGNNQLVELTGEVLAAVDDVSELLIDNNQLTFLHKTNGTFPRLRKVAIEGNPWQCACLDEIFAWLNARHIEYVRRHSPYFKGEKPMCLVTPVEACVRDLRLVRRYSIIDMFEQSAGGNGDDNEQRAQVAK